MDNLERERLIEAGMQMLTRTCAAITLGIAPSDKFPNIEAFIEHIEPQLLMAKKKSKYKEVLDMVWAMTVEERTEFVHEYSKSATADDVFLMFALISITERRRFVTQFEKVYGDYIRRDIIKGVLQELSNIPDFDLDSLNLDSLVDEVNRSVKKAGGERSAAMLAYAEDYIKTRNSANQNKSAEETVRRNIEILDLRATGMSQKKVADRFGLSPRTIRGIERKEADWRLKLRQLDRNSE